MTRTRAEFKQLLKKNFGDDWEKKAIVTPFNVIYLRDLPDEAFGPDFSKMRSPGSYGLFQMLPPTRKT